MELEKVIAEQNDVKSLQANVTELASALVVSQDEVAFYKLKCLQLGEWGMQLRRERSVLVDRLMQYEVLVAPPVARDGPRLRRKRAASETESSEGSDEELQNRVGRNQALL